MNDARTNDLVSAWRAADYRYNRLDRRWPWIKTAMWLLAALAVGGDQVLRLIHADQARDAARKALAEHTGMGDAELARLVDETETGGAK